MSKDSSTYRFNHQDLAGSESGQSLPAKHHRNTYVTSNCTETIRSRFPVVSSQNISPDFRCSPVGNRPHLGPAGKSIAWSSSRRRV